MEISIAAIIIALLGISAGILAIFFVLVPLMKGIGIGIAAIFKGIGWLIAHIFEFVFGIIGDAIRFIGSIPVLLVFGTLSILNIAIGRWSAANHFARSTQRELQLGLASLYRLGIRRPLKLVMLHGLLEGVEERLPQAMGDAPGRDTPTRRTGKFDGYKIVGSLRGGGSGGKLYIADPLPEKKAAIPGIPDRVVIKSFALADGSSLPQIVRETRALECAKQLGHVIEHGMDDSRFHYVMPYIPGDHLGVIARDLHARSAGHGLNADQQKQVMNHMCDLLATLSAYHKGGFWHKDVKPENIIVHDGRAHLVDLGLVTALHSPMTLTTHGTEYFRDPELVRQALRGVKVHQVNGAKFDIFAAGAVLYFLLENTFPAHGVLSRFNKKSPEALHWIVRRAMAEYNQRYPEADMMLADLYHVASASDPFAVRPADLPSMQGGSTPNVAIDAPDPATVMHANTPPPKPAASPGNAGAKGFSLVAGINKDGVFARAGRLDDHNNPAPAADSPKIKGRRPRLRVTNWWTGEYEVQDAGSANDAFGNMQDRVAERAQDAGLSWSAAQRANAKKQIANAQKRVAAAQQRAAAHRKRMEDKDNFTRPFLAVVGLAFVALVVAAVFFTFASSRNESYFSATTTTKGTDVNRDVPPVITILDGGSMDDPTVAKMVELEMASRAREGYDVFFASDSVHDELAERLANWFEHNDHSNEDDFYDESLEDLMEELNVYAILSLTFNERKTKLDETFVYSTRDAAEDRRRMNTLPERPRLLFVSEAEGELRKKHADRLRRKMSKDFGRPVEWVDQSDVPDEVYSYVLSAEGGSDEARHALDVYLRSRNLLGVVHYERMSEDGNHHEVKVHLLDWVEAAIAASPGKTEVADLSDLPLPDKALATLIIVNNHPATRDPDVLATIDDAIEYYNDRGIEVLSDVDAIAGATVALERYRMSNNDKAEAVLQSVLADLNADGVLLIERDSDDHDALLLSLFEVVDNGIDAQHEELATTR